MPQERRQFERLEIFLIVDIKPSGEAANYFLGLTKNISLNGFSFESQNYDLNTGDLMEFKIKDPEGDLHVSVAGKVAWKKVTDFECLVGVKFYGLDEETRNKIAALIPADRELPDKKIVDDEQEEIAANQVVTGPVVGGGSSHSDEVTDEPAAIAEIIAEEQEGQREKQPEVEQDRPETGRRYAKVFVIVTTAAITVAVLLNVETIKNYLLDPLTETPPAVSYKHESGTAEKSLLQEAVPTLHEIPEPEPMDNVLAEGPEEAGVEGFGIEEESSVGPDLMMEFDKDEPAVTAESIPVIPVRKELPAPKPVDAAPEKPAPTARQEVVAFTPALKKPVSAKRRVEKHGPEVAAGISKKSEKKLLANVPDKKKDTLKKSSPQPVKGKSLKSKPAVQVAEKKTTGAARPGDQIKTAGKKPAVVSSGTAKEEKKPLKSKPVSRAESKPASDKKVPEKARLSKIAKVALVTKKSPKNKKALSSDKTAGKDSVQDRPSLAKYIIFEENFNDNSNNWSVFNTKAASARIEDGEYFLENKRDTGSHVVYHYHDFPHDNDFLIEATIRTVWAPGDYSFGFIFGGRDSLNYYSFQVANNHSFSIRRYINGAPDELAVGTVRNVYENLHNIIRVAKQGDNVRFFVNGKYLAKVANLTFFGNKIGFISNGRSEISVDRTYSRIKIEK